MHLLTSYALLSLLLPLLALADSLKTASDLPSPWTYLGCFQDNLNNTRLIPQINGTGYEAGSQMSGKKCVEFCSSDGYTIAGLEYGIQCFCGRNFSSVPPPKLDNSECSMPCSGNADEACGAIYKLTTYYNDKAGVQGTATRMTSDLLSLAVLVIGGTLLL